MSRQAYVEGVTYKDEDTGALKPANQGQVSVYKAGTKTLADIYDTRSGGTPAPNPFLLPDTGMAYFWAETGDYDIEFEDTIAPERFGQYSVGWQSSPIEVEIGVGDLSDEGDIEWDQEPSGAWVPLIKSNAIDAGAIAADAVGTSELQADAVGTSELQDRSAISRKLKPTSGLKRSSGTVELTGEYQDVPDTTLKITPDVIPSILVVDATFWFECDSSGLSYMHGTVSLNGEDQDYVARFFGAAAGGFGVSATVSQTYRLPLIEGLNTIKLRARRVSGTKGTCRPADTGYSYMLIAA